MPLLRILFVCSSLCGAALAKGDRAPAPSPSPSQAPTPNPSLFDSSSRSPAPSNPAQAETHARDTARTRQETSHYLKYGVVHHFGSPGMYLPGAPGTGGHYVGGSGGSFSKHFARCYPVNGTEACNESQWIGFVGEQLRAAVAEVPEAKAVADRIGFTTAMQAASMIAVPIFLFSGITIANGRKDEYGKVKADPGPEAMTLFVLTGVSFLSYVGWNIYEGVVARKAISLYNAGLGVDADAGGRGASLDLSYRF